MSLLTGKAMQIHWSANWDDNLGGSMETMQDDPILKQMSESVTAELEQAFMFYLPRICEHCLNPSCVASCPSGAMYKRAEDGIVLVDQDQCRGWRMCVSGCPYKKVYFNHKTGKAEKCTMCYPRLEVGLPTVCSETCVGRLRYLGLVLYDADRVLEAASVEDPAELLDAQRSVLLDPHDPEVIAGAEREGIPRDWIDAAQRSPIWALISTYKVALPLHPEYRTMPMVWYIPPLSPVVDVVTGSGNDGEDARTLFAAIDRLRIPVEYLAGLFTAGETAPVTAVLQRLAAMRAHMRNVNLGTEQDPRIAQAVGMTADEIEAMYRLLAIAKYEDRYVIPAAHAESAAALEETATGCSLDVDGGPGMGGGGRFGSSSGTPDACRRRDVPRAAQPADRGQRRRAGAAHPRQPAQLGRQRRPTGPVPAGARPGRLRRRAGGRRMSRRRPGIGRPPSLPFLEPVVAHPQGAGRRAHGRVAAARATRRRSCRDQHALLRDATAILSAPVAAAFAPVPRRGRRARPRRPSRCTTSRRSTSADGARLYLSYYAAGDTRRRGMALVTFVEAYRACGWVPRDDELPDHLPTVLELVGARPRPVADALLGTHRAGIELLRSALHHAGSPTRTSSTPCA